MAKSSAVEEKLAQLAAMDLKAPAAADELRAALKHKNNLVVARAAQLALRARMAGLSGDLEQSFTRLLAAGMSADRGCFAKKAIAEALYQMGTGSAEQFLCGVRHVQKEPVFGGSADTAAELRGTCALGLVRIGARQALDALAELIADPEPQARIMAARALAYCGHEHAALPLRVRILVGDRPEVMGECFIALLRIAGSGALPIIARFLDCPDEDIAAESALALGASRLDEAAALLMKCWRDSAGSEKRHMLCSPLAMTRAAEAIELLLEVVASAPEALACSAVDALSMYRSDEAIRDRVAEAARSRGGAVAAAALKTAGA